MDDLIREGTIAGFASRGDFEGRVCNSEEIQIIELSSVERTEWLGAAKLLYESNNLEAMDVVLREARGLYPQSVLVAIEYVKSAIIRQQPIEASSRWEASVSLLGKATPNNREAVQLLIEISEALIKQHNLEACDALLNRGLVMFPGSADLAIRYCLISARRKLWSIALDRCMMFEKIFSDNPHILSCKAEALWMLKDDEQLVTALDRLIEIQPDHVTAAILYARLELRQNRASAATMRLTAAAARWPANKGLLAELNDARMQALLAVDDKDLIRCAPMDETSKSDNLFSHFESLGSGCEFGILQRRFGIEPLGLLRWANITPIGLIQALEERFARIGNVETTALKPIGERYVLMDRVYDMGMQTFIYTSTEPAETLLPKLCSRQRYLARMLVEDIEEGEKILIYKDTESMTVEEIERLWRAVCSYGNCALLIVRCADERLAAGEIEILDSGLMCGAVNHFSNEKIAVEDWTRICTSALETLKPDRRVQQVYGA